MRFSWGWPDRGPRLLCKLGPCFHFWIVAYILPSLTSNRRRNLGSRLNKVTWGRFCISTSFCPAIVIPLLLHTRLSQRFRRAKGCAVLHVNRISPIGWALFKLLCLKCYTHSYFLPCVPHVLPFLSFWDDDSNYVGCLSYTTKLIIVLFP